MSAIINISNAHPAAAALPYATVTEAPAVRSPNSSVSAGPMETDTVELSPLGRALAPFAEQSTYRIAKIRAIRSEIESGAYLTPERIAGTVSRLLDVLS